MLRPVQLTRPLLTALAALSLLAGCGPEREPVVGVMVRRIVPEIPRDVGPVGVDELVERLRVPAGVEPWQVESPRVEVGPLPGFEDGVTQPALLLWGKPKKRVVIPGRFDPESFDELRVELVTRVTTHVAVNLRRGGETIQGSGWIEVVESEVPQLVAARFPRNRFESGPYDELELVVAKDAGGPFCIVELALARVPFSRWVAGEDPASERLVRIGEESRRAVGIASDLPRVVRFLAEPGADARFSYGLDPELRLPGVEPVLRATLSASGVADRTDELPLEPLGKRAPRWHSARIEFGAFAGREVELRFELVDAAAEATEVSPGAFGYLSPVRVQQPELAPRTVLFVTSDTHRADHLGAAGAGVAIATPALDALAARGVLFEQAWSTTNVTLPSHVALLTGVHPRDTRIVDNHTPLADQAVTLAEVFHEQRFRTWAVVSANHLAPDRSGLGQGFERVSAPRASQRAADETLADLQRWIADAQGQPLFVWVHLFDAHTPYEPPAAFEDAYRGESMSMPTDGAALAQLAPEVARERERYRAEVSALDLELGRLFEHPRFRGGVIAVTADHGECLGQHEVYYDHAELYPDSVRVPLLITWPGAPAGARVAGGVQHLALGRTLLELVGVETPVFPGTSLVANLGERAAEPLFALSYGGTSAAVTRGDLHLILHLTDHEVDKGGALVRRRAHELELYDLAADPACERELSLERPDQARALRQVLVHWLAAASEAGAARPSAADPEFLAQLENLGYAGGGSAGEGPWIDPDCACERCAEWR